MATLNEEIHEILIEYGFESEWEKTMQAILDLMCKHRGCEPKMTGWWGPSGAVPIKGPCIYCGKEQP